MIIQGIFMKLTHRPARDTWPESWTCRVLPDGDTEFVDATVDSAAIAAGLAKLPARAPVECHLDRTLGKTWQTYKFVLTDVVTK